MSDHDIKLDENGVPVCLKNQDFSKDPALSESFMLGSFNRYVVIPEGIEVIGKLAFCNCYELNGVILPSSLREIGDSAFYDDIALDIIRQGRSLKELRIPASKTTVFPENLEKIGKKAFYNVPLTPEVYLGPKIKEVAPDAFEMSCVSKIWTACPKAAEIIGKELRIKHLKVCSQFNLNSKEDALSIGNDIGIKLTDCDLDGSKYMVSYEAALKGGQIIKRLIKLKENSRGKYSETILKTFRAFPDTEWKILPKKNSTKSGEGEERALN